jgi:predicted nuclease of restriction endonuclease-like (RecB) superfamily
MDTKLPYQYGTFLKELKTRIQQAQVKAALAVNKELVLLYWHIGNEILTRQNQERWGTKVVERLSNDLRKEFPSMKGLSRTNLLYMRAFAEAWSEKEIVPQLVGQIPWGHNRTILDKIKEKNIRVWYAQNTIKHGWSRNILEHHIDNELHRREGQAITNFASTLPSPQSDLAHQLMKDPYHLDFLDITTEAKERDLETALVARIRDFLLELGAGFAFVGNQYPLKVSDTEYYLDLLFYHLELRCYVIIELKTTEFKPEYSGKMNFYINVVNDLLKKKVDNPTIGIILCRSKDKTRVEYALDGISKPIGVSTHRLPKELEDKLPTIEALEGELETVNVPSEEE